MVARRDQLAIERADQVALRDDDVALGWAEVNDMLNRVVNGLAALDLGPDRRVAVLAENSVETVLAHLGGLLAGASTVPVNFHLNVDEVAFILADSGARALFVGPETAATGVEAARRAGVPVVIGWRHERPAGMPLVGGMARAASPDEPSADVEPRPEPDVHLGHDRPPQGCRAAADDVRRRRHDDRARRRAGPAPFASFGTHLVVGPMYHTGPLSGVRLLAAGIPVVVLGRFDAENVLRAIETHRVETTVMVPTHFVRLLALPEEVRAKYDVSSLQLVAHTGASCPIDVKHSDDRLVRSGAAGLLRRHRGRHDVHDLQRGVAGPPRLGRQRRAAVPGASSSTTTARRCRPAPKAGCSSRTPPDGASIYPGRPREDGRAHLRPGVFTLGEIGYVTDDGFVYITDRFSDMIVSGGVNIYPAEAEQVLIEHPRGRRRRRDRRAQPGHGRGGQGARRARRSGPPAAERRADRLVPGAAGRVQVPALDRHRRDRRPHAMGKVNKRELRRPYWDDLLTDRRRRTSRVAGGGHGARRRSGRAVDVGRAARLRCCRDLVRSGHLDAGDHRRRSPPGWGPPASWPSTSSR